MRDPEKEISGLEKIPVPDQWDEIRSGTSHGPEVAPMRGRLVAGVVAACVAVAGTVLVIRAFDGAPSTHSRLPSLHGQPVEESVLVNHGTMRCTVRFPSDALRPGDPTGVTFTLENLSTRTRTVGLGMNGETGSFRLADANGVGLADTADDHAGIIGGLPTPNPVAPGHSVRIGAEDTWMAWPGPLVATPVCHGVEMPSVRLDIVAPGPAPSTEFAIAQTVSRVRALRICPPPSGGGEAVGTVNGGDQGHPRTFQARCGALVQQMRGFDVVTLYVITPVGAPHIDVEPLASKLGYGPGPIGVKGPAAVNWWRFAVTPFTVRAMNAYSVFQGCPPFPSGGGSGGGPRPC